MKKIKAVNLKTNNMVNPIGINGDRPEFSWQIANACGQSAWQIKCAASAELLAAGELLWDSGKVETPVMAAHLYGGPELKSGDSIFFKVLLWDENGNEGDWSETAFCECGMLSNQDFKACWVGFPAGWGGNAIYFQRNFNLDKKPGKARLYVSASCCVAYCNGVRLGGNAVLQPAQTDFCKSVHYTTYDVTDCVKEGENILAFHVGSGWYGAPVLRYRLDADGKEITLCRMGDLPRVLRSPVYRNSIFGGEEFDARKSIGSGWMTSFDAFPAVRNAFRISGPAGAPRGLEEEPITVQEEIKPVCWEKIGENRYTVDFGRNFSGWCRLKVKAPAGTDIKMLFSEFRYGDKTANQENLLGDEAIDRYIAAGTGDWEVFEPDFTYHGFRYVEVQGLPGEFTADTLTGIICRTNCRLAGDFQCSDELVNKIFTMIKRTEECNLFSVPTDCPQRTERMGWLNDVMARNEGALFLFDESNLMTKWLNDIAEAQDAETGEVPMTAPFYWSFEDSDPVSSSFIESAWNNYIFYGKSEQLYRLYPGFRKWIDRMVSRCNGEYIMRHDVIVGDWCPPVEFNNGHDSPHNFTVPDAVVSTALMHYAVTILSRIAKVTGRNDEAVELDTLAANIFNAFRKEWRCAPGRLQPESQSAYAYAIFCGLFTDDEKQIAADRLAELFAANGYKHTTGNIGTKYLVEVLSAYGYIEYVWKLISSSDYPGWGFMIANGATTMWERWELREGEGMNSHNHPMLGAPLAWFFKYLAGIKVKASSIGADSVELSPCFVKALDYAGAVYESRSGKYSAKWHREGEKVIFDFEIPAGCNADVRMADGSVKNYTAGVYQLTY